MSAIIAGEGGAVLVAAARAHEPPAALVLEGLARPCTAPGGVPAHPVGAMPSAEGVDSVELVAGERRTREAVHEWAAANGLTVNELVLAEAEPPDGTRVVTVQAASTGSGKTALTRRVSRTLKRSGLSVSVARHPLPSLLLWEGRDGASMVRTPAELGGDRPLDEREELAPVVGAGVPVATGTDPRAIVSAAAAEAPVVVLDCGGSAPAWVRPDFRFVVVDLLRPLPEGAESYVRLADAVVLAKADTASAQRAQEIERTVREWNPEATTIVMDMPVAVPEGQRLQDRRVVIVEDWPSLLLGGLRAGAGAVAAKRFRCGVVDPRPFAVGAIRTALETHAHVGAVIPSLGRTPEELDDLAASVKATPGDLVLWASPASPEGLLDDEPRPVLRVYAEMMEVAGAALQEVLQPIIFS